MLLCQKWSQDYSSKQSSGWQMQTLRAESVSELIQKLSNRYRIRQENAPCNFEEADEMLRRKPNQCKKLEERVKQLEIENKRLREGKSNNSESRSNCSEPQLKSLQKRIQIFEETFRQEEQFVNELKEMLAEKEQRIKQIVCDYQTQLYELRSLEGPEKELQLRNEIKELKAMLREQQDVMIDLAGSNARMAEENRLLKRRVGENSKKN